MARLDEKPVPQNPEPAPTGATLQTPKPNPPLITDYASI